MGVCEQGEILMKWYLVNLFAFLLCGGFGVSALLTGGNVVIAIINVFLAGANFGMFMLGAMGVNND